MITTQECIKRSVDLIEETGWAQNALARDADEKVMGYLRPEACKFCPIGAVLKVIANAYDAGELTDMQGLNLKGKVWCLLGPIVQKDLRKHVDIEKHYPQGIVATWNDQHYQTKKNVIKLLRGVAI